MTDEPTTLNEYINQNYQSPTIWDEPDHLLAALVDIVQASSEGGLSITLTTTGGTVTGMLVGRTQWYDELLSFVGEANQELFAGLRPLVDGPELDAAVETTTAFIHLLDARAVQSGAFLPGFDGSGCPWRGRLSEVVGWHIGLLGS